MFFHSLDTIPQQWYIETKLQHGTMDWHEMMEGLLLSYSLANRYECIKEALQEVKVGMF